MRTLFGYVLAALFGALAATVGIRCAASARVPVDYEHTGAERGYSHGPHCIDGRTF
jgi:hypothetical protein